MMSNNWERVRLKDVIEINPKESIKKGEIAKKIAMEKLEPYTKFIDKYDTEEFKGGTKFRNGDTLVARITPCLENGKTSQVTILDENEVGFGSTEFIVFREKKGITNKDFIYYFSISPYFRDIAIKSMIGSSGRQRVQIKSIEELEFSLPPLETQEKIANILSSLDDKIENNKKTAEKLEEIAQTLFNRWFVEFNFPDENGLPYKDNGGEMVESELGLIPKGAIKIPITEMAEFINGLALKKFPPNENSKALKVLKIRELRQGFCDDSSDLATNVIDSKYKIKENDLIFSWSGSLLVDFWYGETCFLNQHLFNVQQKKGYSKEFMFLVLKYFIDSFIHIAASKQTTMGHIKRSDLENAILPVYSENIIQEFEKIIIPITKKQNLLMIENKKLYAILETLLPKLINESNIL